MTKPACLPQLSAPWPLSQVMLRTLAFGSLSEDIFQCSVLFDSIIPCRFKALCTNQKMDLHLWCRFGVGFFVGVGLVCFFWSPFSCECGSCFLFGEAAEVCHSGREGASCQRQDQAGVFLACDLSLSQMWPAVLTCWPLLDPDSGKARRETAQKK